MELHKVSQEIENKIKLLETHRAMLPKLANDKANAISVYEKSIALCIMRLKNGVMEELEGQTILNPPVTIIEKIAKGICHKERFDMEVAESGYKACVINLNVIQAQLNGWQSVNRFLKEV